MDKFPEQLPIKSRIAGKFYIDKISEGMSYTPGYYFTDVIYTDSIGNYWWCVIEDGEEINLEDFENQEKWNIIPYHIVSMIHKKEYQDFIRQYREDKLKRIIK